MHSLYFEEQMQYFDVAVLFNRCVLCWPSPRSELVHALPQSTVLPSAFDLCIQIVED